MSNTDSILANAGLPFDLSADDTESAVLLAAVPNAHWNALNNAHSHFDVTHACDQISIWIEHNWRRILPVISARFPMS